MPTVPACLCNLVSATQPFVGFSWNFVLGSFHENRFPPSVLLRDANELLSALPIFIVGKVQYKPRTRCDVEHWRVSWQVARGSEWNYLNRCTVKPDDILKVRHLAVKFVTDHVIWNFHTCCLEKFRLHTRRPAFYPRPVVATFVVYKVTLWQVSLSVRRFFSPPCQYLSITAAYVVIRGYSLQRVKWAKPGSRPTRVCKGKAVPLQAQRVPGS